MRDDLDLPFADLRDLDRVAEVAGAAVDLDAVVQELLEGGNVEDLVAGRLSGVDDELRFRARRVSFADRPLTQTMPSRRSVAKLSERFVSLTFNVVFCCLPLG